MNVGVRAYGAAPSLTYHERMNENTYRQHTHTQTQTQTYINIVARSSERERSLAHNIKKRTLFSTPNELCFSHSL